MTDVNIQGTFSQLFSINCTKHQNILGALHDASQQRVVLKMTLDTRRGCVKKRIGNHDSTLSRQLTKEAWCLDTLEHPHLVTTNHAVLNHLNWNSCQFTSVDHYEVLLQQYANQGDLFDFMYLHRFIPEKCAQPIMGQILSAVNHLHSLGIAHMDIKLENIVLDKPSPESSCVAKLCDFGLAKIQSFHDEVSSLTDPCGTFSHMAPEMIHSGAWVNVDRVTPFVGKSTDDFYIPSSVYGRAHPYYPCPSINDINKDGWALPHGAASDAASDDILFNGYKTDMWSLGVCFFNIVTGLEPVREATLLCNWFRVLFVSHDAFWKRMNVTLDVEHIPHPSAELKTVLRDLLAPHHCRVNAKTLEGYKFFQY